MPNPKVRVEPAETEAAAWHARLGEPRVSGETIEAFFSWREKPENADAYRRVEVAWSETGALANDPDILGAVDAAMSRKGSDAARPRDRRRLFGLGAVFASLAAGLVIWTLLPDRNLYETSVGETRVVQLADGSSVRLDTASRMQVRFDGDRRLIDLEAGQALFTVAHDASRPFVVTAGSAQVTAVGTVFDVRRDKGEVRVTLVSGAVDVVGGQRVAQRLKAGHQARVTGEGVAARAVDVPAETGWTEGRIVFRDVPLEQAVGEVNRYLTDGIELDAPGRETELVSGVFRTGDRDAFVSAATSALVLRASAGKGGGVRLTAEK